MDVRKGEHVPASSFEDCPRIGSQELPFAIAPTDWDENGLPYGAWCVCSLCGFLGRSTLAFDYYAKKPGDPLVCETCKLAAK